MNSPFFPSDEDNQATRPIADSPTGEKKPSKLSGSSVPVKFSDLSRPDPAPSRRGGGDTRVGNTPADNVEPAAEETVTRGETTRFSDISSAEIVIVPPPRAYGSGGSTTHVGEHRENRGDSSADDADGDFSGRADAEEEWVPQRKKMFAKLAEAPEMYVPQRKEHTWGSFLKSVIVPFFSVILVGVLIQTFILQIFTIPSESMEDTLTVHDKVAVWKLGGVSKGDVVVFRDPGGWIPAGVRNEPAIVSEALSKLNLAPSTDTGYLVKRVIGTAGDKIECCTPDGKIIVNDIPQTEPYIKPGQLTDQKHFSITVPEGMVFVMGDNRGNSADSRYHLDVDDGGVPIGNIVGKNIFTF